MSLQECWDDFHRNKHIEPFNDIKCKAEFINSGDVKVVMYREGFKHDSLKKDLVSKLNLLNVDRESYLLKIERVIEFNDFFIQSPISGREIKCINSIGTQLFNFLMFKDGNEIFYIVQNHQIIAGIYRPLYNEYIQFSGGNINGYVKHLKRSFLKLGVAMKETRASFLLLFSCPRPWHFFYNQATALSILSENLKPSSKSVTFGYLAGGDFMDPSVIDARFKYKKTTLSDLEDGKNSPFLLGINFDSISSHEHELLRKKVLNSITKAKVEPNKASIWIGITSQKRSWLEQVEAISELIITIVNKGIPLHVNFDGWTSPISRTANDEKNIASDTLVVEEILSRTKNSNYSYTNIVGMTALEKIKIALKTDVYVANYASGSLFVSRFAGISGLSHLNNNMERNHHIHHANTEINKSLVKDINEEGKRGHHISYSISVSDFISEFKAFYGNLKIESFNYLRLEK